MRRSSPAIAALIFFCWANLSFAADAMKSSASFPMDAYLEPRALFWVDIFTKYNSWNSVVHSTRYPQIIFTVLPKNYRAEVSATIKKFEKILERLRAKEKKLFGEPSAASLTEKQKGIVRKELEGEELQIWDLFEKNGLSNRDRFSPPKYTSATVRAQRGLRDNILESFFKASRYERQLKRIFSEKNLPVELIFLPLVESGFETTAVSHAGAVGIWQFMPQTGKQYLRVDAQLDERQDPMRSAEAAAFFLQESFARFQSWPLALTAYNHGPSGVERAVAKIGSKNISQIIQHYESPNFGFASANYYASFLAAVQVMQNSWHYFGSTPAASRLEFDEFVVPDAIRMRAIYEYTGIDPYTLRDLNPALREAVWQSELPLPIGYTLRIPMSNRDKFLSQYEQIPIALRSSK